ncbi:MAG: CpsB/CapC family capsule biosynthesis tyrosine phosphatase [Oscillospiraceae bacterium]
MFVDCHTHILPNIDDGSKSIEMSIQMIDMLLAQETSQIWLTPHFDALHQTIDDFTKSREKAFEEILLHYNRELFVLGSEVFLSEPLLACEDISQLCIANTPYILIELDASYEFEKNEKMLSTLISKYAVTPIIAHIERYAKVFVSDKAISNLLELGCGIQMNTKIFKSMSFNRALAIERISNGEISLLGTDCHNMELRTPEFLTAIDYIEKKLGKEILKKFETTAAYISTGKEKKLLFI